MATPAIIAAGHIHLILSHSTDDFYLEIPISVVQSNSVRPIKYLRFLGWCIIGILGTVKSDREGVDIVDTALLQDRGAYFYVYAASGDDAALQYAVDLVDVIRGRSHISASDSSIRARGDAFKDSLLQRDASCMFTDVPPLLCEATHIIPFHKGDEWFGLIVKNRPASPDEDVSTLTTVDDQRNGMLLGVEAHIVAESRQVVVVKTPNLVLAVGDVPPRHPRALTQIPNTRMDNATLSNGCTAPRKSEQLFRTTPTRRSRNNLARRSLHPCSYTTTMGPLP